MTTTCANHPAIETALQCNRCGAYICAKCATRTPTGYRCPTCIRTQQKVFDTALWYDYLSAFIVGAIGSVVASILVMLISSFFFGILILAFAPFAGQMIARVIQIFIKNRRARRLFLTAIIGIIIGGLPIFGYEIYALIQYFQWISEFAINEFSFWEFLPLVWHVAYLAMAVPAAYSQLSGIQLFK